MKPFTLFLITMLLVTAILSTTTFAEGESYYFTPYAYYLCDGNTTDFTTNFSLVPSGITYVTGKLGQACEMADGTDNAKGSFDRSTSQINTFDFWYKNNGQTGGTKDELFSISQNPSFENTFYIRQDGAERLWIYFFVNNSLKVDFKSSAIMSLNTWNHIVLTRDTQWKIYINGTLDATAASDFAIPNGFGANTGFGITPNNGTDATGIIDNFFISSDVYSADNASFSYNSGAGIIQYYESNDSIPVFNPPTPANRSVGVTNFDINTSCGVGFNVSLYLATDTVPIIPVVLNQPSPNLYSTNLNVSGEYYYRASCDGGSTFGETRLFTYDLEEPLILLNGGNAFTSANETVDRYATSQFFNVSIEDNIELFGFLFNVSLGGVEYFSYQNESLGGTTFNWSHTLDVSSYPKGIYSVDVFASDGHTKKEICPFNDLNCYKPKKKQSEIEFDTPEGVNVRVVTKETSTVDTVKLQDRQTFEFAWADGKSNKNRKLDLFSSHAMWYVGWRSGIAGHFVIPGDSAIGGNWIDFEGEGLAFEDVSVKKITDYHYEITIKKPKNHQKFESIGGLNTNHNNYALIIAGLNSSVRILPSQPTKFSNLAGQCVANETGGSPSQFEWKWFNNTVLFNESSAYSGNLSDSTWHTLNTILAATLQVGDNWTFSCHARSFGIETAWQNYTAGTVLDTLVGNCTAQLPYPVLNMTYFDEISGQPITVDNGVSFFFDDGQLVRNFTANFEGNFHDSICTNLDPAILPYQWDMWGDILGLEKSGYATRTFNIPFSEAITVNNTNPYELELQLIPLNQSTTVQYTWLTTSYQPISGTMRVYRCNLDATETLTDSLPIIQGSVAANIELINTLYRYDVIIDGTLYSDPTSYSLCHTETLSERQFFVDVTQLEMDQKLGMYDILCSVVESSPNVVLMNWSTNPYSSLPITGCLEAYRYGISGWNNYYEDCESSAFSIQRTIPQNGNDYQVRGRLYQGGLAVGCNDIVTVASNKAGQQFGATALLAVLFLIIALSLIWSGKGQGAIVGAAVAVAASWFLGITNLPWIAVSAIISFLVIIAWIARANTRS